MSHGIRPPGKWNEACVNMKTFTSPEALKADKIFTDFKASMVYGFQMGFFYEPSLSLCNVGQNWAMKSLYRCISTRNKCKIQIEFRCLKLNTQNQVSYIRQIYAKTCNAWTHWQTYIVARIFEPGEILMSILDDNWNISASHLYNNIIQKLQGNNLSPGNQHKVTWHALTKTCASNPLGIFWEF